MKNCNLIFLAIVILLQLMPFSIPAFANDKKHSTTNKEESLDDVVTRIFGKQEPNANKDSTEDLSNSNNDIDSKYSNTDYSPTSSNVSVASFTERKKYGINTSESYTGWEEDLEFAKKQERNNIIFKIIGSIIGVVVLALSFIFVKNLLTKE